MDRPSPPVGPIKFTDVTTESVTISWEKPLSDGGVELSNYVVEKQEKHGDWQPVSASVLATTLKVCKLTTISLNTLNKVSLTKIN